MLDSGCNGVEALISTEEVVFVVVAAAAAAVLVFTFDVDVGLFTNTSFASSPLINK